MHAGRECGVASCECRRGVAVDEHHCFRLSDLPVTSEGCPAGGCSGAGRGAQRVQLSTGAQRCRAAALRSADLLPSGEAHVGHRVMRSGCVRSATLHAYKASSARSPLRVPVQSPVAAAPSASGPPDSHTRRHSVSDLVAVLCVLILQTSRLALPRVIYLAPRSSGTCDFPSYPPPRRDADWQSLQHEGSNSDRHQVQPIATAPPSGFHLPSAPYLRFKPVFGST